MAGCGAICRAMGGCGVKTCKIEIVGEGRFVYVPYPFPKLYRDRNGAEYMLTLAASGKPFYQRK